VPYMADLHHATGQHVLLAVRSGPRSSRSPVGSPARSPR